MKCTLVIRGEEQGYTSGSLRLPLAFSMMAMSRICTGADTATAVSRPAATRGAHPRPTPAPMNRADPANATVAGSIEDGGSSFNFEAAAVSTLCLHLSARASNGSE
jgi:hypothetical protein